MVDFFNSVINNFSDFFNWDNLSAVLSSPTNWGFVLTLVILEGLLSADNALVLAVMVKHLPKEQQKKALFYGIIGAYLFRFISIGIGVYLVKITWIKVAGGVYLLWIALSNLFGLEVKFVKAGGVPILPYIGKKDDGEEGEVENKGLGFWRTVLAVELMDIAFSIDSVLAAFGVSDQVWVLFLGGILGVLMMRGVAQLFLKLIDKFPELEQAAFILIVIIGAKMIAGAFGFEVSHYLFFGLLIAVFVGTMIYSAVRGKNESEAKTA
ncbi:YkoY family integral membrane protein [Paenibacillus cellulosilyticus]|uniref:YkoY family integral membrane protein n=1 Tax=Paenibacillus cellulosilyticus TaxID=375489 RepID=A0A2V2YP21_9BACL|nr:TerC family protein [Paenibacillus cellulosilyticus]PWV97888.1 YkoY family integral membrane protein [Paenibacillus cellulosilyticus]QKS46941.1 TerC family protein [Paenibacillus cellulosilyticus]